MIEISLTAEVDPGATTDCKTLARGWLGGKGHVGWQNYRAMAGDCGRLELVDTGF